MFAEHKSVITAPQAVGSPVLWTISWLHPVQHFSPFLSYRKIHRMALDPLLESIMDQAKIDVISPTYVDDNAKQLDAVSRNFICGSLFPGLYFCNHNRP